MIEFRKITWDNYGDCLKLKVAKEQENFVGSVKSTLAECFIGITNGDKMTPYAIYANNEVVGFIVYWYYPKSEDADNPEISVFDNGYLIWRILFDVKHQGKGYGKQAVEKVIEEIKTYPFGKADYIYLSYEPENIVSKHLFHSFGFADTDKKFAEDDDEIIARLEIKK